MYLRAALLLLLLMPAAQMPAAQAAPFDNLKEDLATCLRFELEGARAQRQTAARAKAAFALQRCSVEVERLDRADGRRLRSDQGLSPSTWSVLEGVLGTGRGGRR